MPDLNIQTKVPINPLNSAKLSDSFFYFGSCFAQHNYHRAKELGLPSQFSPFGISYNPIALSHHIQVLLSERVYTREDLQTNKDHSFFSYDHHGDYSGFDADQVLSHINRDLIKGRTFLRTARFLVWTLGTSFIYRRKKNQKVVNNCHKQPASEFTRDLLDPKTICSELTAAIQALRKINPQCKLIFSVSPVRHLRDSFVENSRSKATLILAVHQAISEMEDCHYFPAFEIMMDELRDYRFYSEDMCHPSPLATDYISSSFMEFIYDPKEKSVLSRLEKLKKRRSHRILQPGSSESQRFLAETKAMQLQLQSEFEFLDFQTTF